MPLILFCHLYVEHAETHPKTHHSTIFTVELLKCSTQQWLAILESIYLYFKYRGLLLYLHLFLSCHQAASTVAVQAWQSPADRAQPGGTVSQGRIPTNPVRGWTSLSAMDLILPARYTPWTTLVTYVLRVRSTIGDFKCEIGDEVKITKERNQNHVSMLRELRCQLSLI